MATIQVHNPGGPLTRTTSEPGVHAACRQMKEQQEDSGWSLTSAATLASQVFLTAKIHHKI